MSKLSFSLHERVLSMRVLGLVLGFLCVGLFACEQTSLSGGTQKGSTASNDKADNQDDEKVDPPNNISGAYLHCVTEVEPSASKAEALVGCRLDDAAGNRVATTTIATSATYTYKALNDANIQVYAKQLTGDARYDAVYLFFGPDRESVLTAIAKTQVLVKLQAAKSTGTDTLLGDQIADIGRDKSTISEIPNNDYSKVRDDVLVEAQQGQVTPPIP
jgi:hypothetical protein